MENKSDSERGDMSAKIAKLMGHDLDSYFGLTGTISLRDFKS